MPELPEVETVRRGLEPVMTGKRIVRADVRRADLRWPFPERMAERLQGCKVLGLRRRSKYILCDLDSDETLLIHLGMSGRILISGEQPGQLHHDLPTPEKHDHVVLDIEGGARITYNDARRFGAMDLLSTTGAEDHKLLSALGPEPFGNGFNAEVLTKALGRKRSPIKSVLLDQRVVAGLGNIYVCEILWRCGIAPDCQALDLIDRADDLVRVTRDVLNEAIDAGGSSLRDHRQTNGELGYFQHSFAAYGREGETCRKPECGGEITRIVQSGRSSFFCPECQRQT